MDIIKVKSDENIAAAQLLINNNMYASSVHCTYYACFQLMKYVLHKKLNYSYNVQEQCRNKAGSHEKIINVFLTQVINKNKNKRMASYVTNLMFKLKERRVAADYSNDEIDIAFINDVIEISRDINDGLNSI